MTQKPVSNLANQVATKRQQSNSYWLFHSFMVHANRWCFMFLNPSVKLHWKQMSDELTTTGTRSKIHFAEVRLWPLLSMLLLYLLWSCDAAPVETGRWAQLSENNVKYSFYLLDNPSCCAFTDCRSLENAFHTHGRQKYFSSRLNSHWELRIPLR